MTIAGDGGANISHADALGEVSQFRGDAQKHFVTGNQLRQFDIILTNPPFSTSTKVLAVKAAHFDLAYRLKQDKGVWIKKGKKAKIVIHMFYL